MITKLIVRNFKRFDNIEVDLDRINVFIGPNNMGKTSALQALTLWEAGLQSWTNKYGFDEKEIPQKRPGVTINRTELKALPVPSAILLWKDLHVRKSLRENGKQRTENVRIEILVQGFSSGKPWECGFEFDYANEESMYCRPLLKSNGSNAERIPVPKEATHHRIAYLPPMSGLADREFVKQRGEIDFLIGQGQTAQVLRNLCYNLYNQDDKSKWQNVTKYIEDLFGVKLLEPKLNPVRSELTMSYKDLNSKELDLSCAGRGLHQTLLVLVFLYTNPNSVLLLDEPDAHLEILRQRQVFNLLSRVAETMGSQIIAASHSEVILEEAVEKGKITAFLGKPHPINEKNEQLLKSLTSIGFDQYYQAEQTGWVLYLEGTTDLDILRTFAEKLNHPAKDYLSKPFLCLVGNQPQKARDHFYGLLEAKNDLLGIAIFDRLDKNLRTDTQLIELMWKKREIENYLCLPEALEKFATSDIPDDLFGFAEKKIRLKAMKEAISEVTIALKTLGKPEPWSEDIKASDDFLTPIFKKFSEKLGLPLVLRKNEYYRLAQFVPEDKIDREIVEKLDAIFDIASKAKTA